MDPASVAAASIATAGTPRAADPTSVSKLPLTEDFHDRGYSKIKAQRCSFTWTILNFSRCREQNGDILRSSVFPTAASAKFIWRLAAYPRGNGKQSKDYLSLFLELVDCDSIRLTKVLVTYTFCILYGKNKELKAHEIKLYNFGDPRAACGLSRYVALKSLRDKAHRLMPDDNLTIFCEVTAEADRVSGYFSKYQIETPECTLSRDLGSVFENQKFGDVTLSVGDEQLLAHKVVLAARSPIFAAMFEHDMEERQQNRVVITDMDYEILKEMVLYMYTGRSANIDKLASNLLIAADRYDLNGLKVMCEGALCSTLTAENASDTLVFAKKYNAQQLRTKATLFIKEHFNDVMDSLALKNMVERLSI